MSIYTEYLLQKLVACIQGYKKDSLKHEIYKGIKVVYMVNVLNDTPTNSLCDTVDTPYTPYLQ
jgi:hypothetical protein